MFSGVFRHSCRSVFPLFGLSGSFLSHVRRSACRFPRVTASALSSRWILQARRSGTSANRTKPFFPRLFLIAVFDVRSLAG